MSLYNNPVTVMSGAFATGAEMHSKTKKELQEMTDAYQELLEFAQEVLMIALENDPDEHRVDITADRWEQLTGEVYGIDYCRDKVSVY